MANEIPNSEKFTGLCQKVLLYSEVFHRVVGGAQKDGWADLEEMIDVDTFEREGVFLRPVSEKIGWAEYKKYLTQFAGSSEWEGSMRRITEVPGRVFLELEERITREGKRTVANTVTIYDFNKAGKLTHLDVYVSPKA
jgi:hypothetical protein